MKAERREIDPDTRRAARVFIEKVRERYDLRGAVLFGSRARQTHRPDSDADIAVLLRGPPLPFLETKLSLADIAFDVLLETGVLVQPLPVSEDEWEHPERFRSPELLTAIRREGVRL